MFICDAHAHVFPDKIALKASESIGAFYNYPMAGTGTVDELKSFYREAGISHALIFSVAIVPKNVTGINTFIADTVSKNPGLFTGFGAVHPDCENLPGLMDEVRTLGLKGLKIHPDMQQFALDDPRAFAMFDVIQEAGLPVVVHTGDRRFRYSNPDLMKKVFDNFPRLVCVCAHLGGNSEWDEAVSLLRNYENFYTDTSSSLYFMEPEKAVSVIRNYDREHIFFGTDYPMWKTDEELERFLSLPLTDKEKELILGENVRRFIKR